MAKNDKGNQAPVSGDQVAPEQRDAEGNPSAARDGESALSFAAVNEAIENRVNPMTAEQESERQRAENFPNASSVTVFRGQHEDGPERVRAGYASTHRAVVGRVVVLHQDEVYEKEVYKAGTQDLPVDVADYFIGEGLAYEPAGKKKGR